MLCPLGSTKLAARVGNSVLTPLLLSERLEMPSDYTAIGILDMTTTEFLWGEIFTNHSDKNQVETPHTKHLSKSKRNALKS